MIVDPNERAHDYVAELDKRREMIQRQGAEIARLREFISGIASDTRWHARLRNAAKCVLEQKAE